MQYGISSFRPQPLVFFSQDRNVRLEVLRASFYELNEELLVLSLTGKPITDIEDGIS